MAVLIRITKEKCIERLIDGSKFDWYMRKNQFKKAVLKI